MQDVPRQEHATRVYQGRLGGGGGRIASIIPGVNTPEHLAKNVKACQERDPPTSAKEDQAIRQCQKNFYANLAPQYQWLRKWELV